MAITNKLGALLLAAGVSAVLSGCAVVAAADFAATTVFTVGKVAVKTTGAVVGAAADGVSALTSHKEESPPPAPEAPAP